MPRDGRITRNVLLDAAERLVLERGFEATTIEALIARAGVTKGTFFYHFASKSDLGHALITRHAQGQRAALDAALARAEATASDPLDHVFALLRDFADSAMSPPPGTLFASYIYEIERFDAKVLAVIRDATGYRLARIAEKLSAAMRAHPPCLPVTARALAASLLAAIEGGHVLARILGDPAPIASEIDRYRAHLGLVFAFTPEPPAGVPPAGRPASVHASARDLDDTLL